MTENNIVEIQAMKIKRQVNKMDSGRLLLEERKTKLI